MNSSMRWRLRGVRVGVLEVFLRRIFSRGGQHVCLSACCFLSIDFFFVCRIVLFQNCVDDFLIFFVLLSLFPCERVMEMVWKWLGNGLEMVWKMAEKQPHCVAALIGHSAGAKVPTHFLKSSGQESLFLSLCFFYLLSFVFLFSIFRFPFPFFYPLTVIFIFPSPPTMEECDQVAEGLLTHSVVVGELEKEEQYLEANRLEDKHPFYRRIHAQAKEQEEMRRERMREKEHEYERSGWGRERDYRRGAHESEKEVGPSRRRKEEEREQRDKREDGKKSKSKRDTENGSSDDEKGDEGDDLTPEKLQELWDKYRTGGVYLPPARVAQLRARITDKKSKEYQRLAWDALKKSINGLVNKANVSNVQNIVVELFKENLIRGKGLLCRAILKAQLASPTFTNVFAALLCVINTKFPEIGELFLHRLVLQFRSAFKRNDRLPVLSSAKFLAHLVNQQVAHEVIALQLLTLLLDVPTDDSVEVAVGFMKDVGATLAELSPKATHAVFERFRGILHEGEIDKRVQYLIEGLFAVRRNKFEELQSVIPELDLVEEDDRITHEVSLSEEFKSQLQFDVFRYEEEYEENDEKYAEIKREILGEEAEDDIEEDDEEDDGEGDEGMDIAEELQTNGAAVEDMSEEEKMVLRRDIYTTIMNSVSFEEATHKLLRMGIKPGQEGELVLMTIKCCIQEKTYVKFYGLIADRLCHVSKIYQELYEEAFAKQYATIHRLETNKIRNVGRMFGHLLYRDAISWGIMQCISLTESTSTSSTRIFAKILFQDLVENMGFPALRSRLNDADYTPFVAGLFPTANARDTRFAIKYWTAIGIGGLTDGLRKHLKEMPRLIMEESDGDDGDDSSDDDDDSDDDSSESGASSDDDDDGSSSSGSGSDDDSGSESDGSSDSKSSSHSERAHPREKKDEVVRPSGHEEPRTSAPHDAPRDAPHVSGVHDDREISRRSSYRSSDRERMAPRRRSRSPASSYSSDSDSSTGSREARRKRRLA
jgi:pre-mRNA-splicing factor CWC22